MHLGQRFARVVDNWYAIMIRTKKLTAFTATYSQASVIFPYIMVAPAYFAGKLQLGGMMQTASAFSSVQDALSFFITAYRTLAEWKACISRLEGFETAIADAQAMKASKVTIAISDAQDDGVVLNELHVALPDGTPLVEANGIRFDRRQRTLFTGPSGSGKSTLFRAIAGIWPFGHGKVTIPAGASMMMLPQRPYFPVGTLHQAIAYPHPPGSYSHEAIAQAIASVGLPALAARLDEEQHWNRQLSLGEQQRLGIARALLQKPDTLFLDEATASLDEPAEVAMYRLIAQHLPATTLVSIGHRGTLHALHDRTVSLTRRGEHYALGENRVLT